MELPRHVLRSQRSTPSTDFQDNGQTRRPLRESTGNAQPHHIGAVDLCHQNFSGLTTLPSSIPTPVLPTQPLGSNYGAAGSLRLRRHHLQKQRRERHAINPIYLSAGFKAYRKKQGEKDDKSAQIWPDVLEDAFLDALLLIPQMGRRKYTMRGQQFGRNMLISEYLWVAYCLSLPPGQKPNKTMWRERKQVSSHIQVLKHFFTFHRCYHFFFPREERKDDRKDPVEAESFKDNPVLRALSEGRLPSERPNYDYFAALLASDAHVAFRPSLCWMLVSSTAVKVEADGPLRGEGFKSDGEQLDPVRYPHLHHNLKREEWPERGKIIRGTLLQEYTRTLAQKEASSVKEISYDWEHNFPELFESLDEVVQENLRDILHFHVTLDVQEPDRFPEASELNALVEVNVELAALQNHKWKSVTRLARPWELTRDAKTDPQMVEISKEMGNQYMHRPGCENRENQSHCDCFLTARLRRQQLAVPFPADEWATMLSHLAAYRKHRLDDKPRVKSESDDGDSKGTDGNEPTQIDLVRKVAMYQELWSAPSEGGQAWTRRGVILWTFETVYSMDEKEKRFTKSLAGTHWRFLTAIDPTSRFHQQQALVSSQNASSSHRDAVMSPHPGYQQHMNAAMSENFGSAWDTVPSLSIPSSHPVSLPHYDSASLSMLDPFSGGLATPPPTASLQSSYPSAFDSSHPDLHSQLSFLSASTVDRDTPLVSGSAADSFMSTSGDLTVYEDASPVDCNATSAIQAWDSDGIPAIDSQLDNTWHHNFNVGNMSNSQHNMLSWEHEALGLGSAPNDLKVSANHWAAATSTAVADGWSTNSTTTPTSEFDGGKDNVWSSQQGWMQQWDGSLGSVHAEAQGQQQQQQVAEFGPELSPLKSLKRCRADSLDERENYPLTKYGGGVPTAVMMGSRVGGNGGGE